MFKRYLILIMKTDIMEIVILLNIIYADILVTNVNMAYLQVQYWLNPLGIFHDLHGLDF